MPNRSFVLVADVVRIHERAVLVDLHAGQAFEVGAISRMTKQPTYSQFSGQCYV